MPGYVNALSYEAFKKMVLGRGYDIDYSYGWQCWDGYAEYCIYQGVPYASCTVTHYVQDIWTQRATNGMLKYFYEVHELQPGDVVVFRPCSVTPTSHIAIFDSDAGGGYGNFLGQNQGNATANPAGGYAFSITKLPYWATYDTAFRPKKWSKGTYVNTSSIGYAESQLINENGTAILNAPIKKRRDRPDGIVAETLKAGTKLRYTNKWVGNGHRYISWVEKQADGCQYRYFVAISGSEVQGKDMWATIEGQEATNSKTYSETQLINETGIATLTVAVKKRRDSPTGIVAETLKVGTKLNYTQKWVGNGHRYISWVETEPNGNKYRYFVAISGSETQGKDLWATFSAPENKNPTTETKAETKAVDTKNVLHWGIDVSEHNDVDVSKYDFVIIRACYGENTDKKFKNYVEQAEHAGIPYGLYLYDYALDDSEAHAETAYLLNLAKSCNPTLGLWIDLETDNYKKKHNSWTKERSSATAEIFLDDLKNSGYYTGIYTSTWFHDNWYPDFKCDFWIANYEEADQGNYHLDTSSMGTINQYTSIDKESGKALDHDAMYVEFGHYKSNIAENTQKSDENAKNNDVLDDDTKADNSENEEMKGLLSTIISLLKKLLSVFGKSSD